MFSFKSPSFIIRPRFSFALLQGSSAFLYIMCLRSLSRPGFFGRPCANHFSLDCPPFHALVVNPRISHLTLHLSKVLASISVDIAAIDIGLPRIDPELSINKETIVSLKFVLLSCLKLNGVVGFNTTRDSLAASNNPSSRSNFQVLFCLACSLL